jgi:hypothetical protein
MTITKPVKGSINRFFFFKAPIKFGTRLDLLNDAARKVTGREQMSKSQRCRICLSPSLKDFWQFQKVPYGDLYKHSREEAIQVTPQELTLSQCPNCRLFQLNENPKIEDIYVDYLYETQVTVRLNDFYDELAAVCSGGLSEPTSKKPFIVDIGSNDGTFLNSFLKRGWDVLGVEPSRNAAERANQNSIKTINSFFDESCRNQILLKFGKPDLISCNYVLANIVDLDTFFRNIVQLMSAETSLRILTGYHPDQFSINMFEYINHDHITYLTLKDFANIGKRFGLKVINASRFEYKGGSIQIEMKSENSKSVISPNVPQLMQRERFQNTQSQEYVLELRKRLVEINQTLINFLENSRQRRFSGIGASISTTHLIHEFQLNSLIEKLYDDDARKVGKFSPGLGIEVFPLKEIVEEGETYVILLAWQHTERIISRLTELGFRGQLIIPLPNFLLIEF